MKQKDPRDGKDNKDKARPGLQISLFLVSLESLRSFWSLQSFGSFP
jgi:hypothetical protein